MMKSLKLVVTLMALALAPMVAANPLYSWTTKDGTPTYSPDPPPKGVAYEIVGADLKPLQTQPASTSQAAAEASPANAPADNLVLSPKPARSVTTSTPPAKSKTAWKPVVYADDPNPNDAGVELARAEPANAAAQSRATANADNQISTECFSVLKQIRYLEDRFANAFTATQMDNAVVRLHEFRKQNKGSCGL